MASPPFLKVVTGEKASEEELGGAEMHAQISGLCDYLVKDEREAISTCRDVVKHFNWKKLGENPTENFKEPVYNKDDMLGFVSKDLKSPFDIREVIARVADGSEFEEFKSKYDINLICGWSSVHGYPVAFIGNNGPLFPKGAAKAAQFIQLCNMSGTPIVFLTNLPGMMVGVEYEQAGMAKEGAKMINAVTNSTVPHISIICGGSYGAGAFAMSNPRFDTRFNFMWPLAKTGFVGAKPMSDALFMMKMFSAIRKGEKFDQLAEVQKSKIARETEEERSTALFAASRVVNDGVIDPRDTRTILGFTLSVCHNKEVKGTKEYATWRM